MRHRKDEGPPLPGELCGKSRTGKPGRSERQGLTLISRRMCGDRLNGFFFAAIPAKVGKRAEETHLRPVATNPRMKSIVTASTVDRSFDGSLLL